MSEDEQGNGAPTNKKTRSTPVLHVLTVGEGDFSLSLALVRAYGSQQITLTASTIVPSRDHLSCLYPHVGKILDELLDRGVQVRYGVDATQLHKVFGGNDNVNNDSTPCAISPTPQLFDLILFYHPHLGIIKDKDKEVEQAQRHVCLMAHYLASASTRLKPLSTSKVHLCLCGTQPETWKVRETAQRLGLKEIAPGKPTPAAPWHDVMYLPSLLLDETQSTDNNIGGFAAPRKYRNGKHGSRHWLGKYGYCHRRTQGELYEGSSTDTNVECSVDLLFQTTEHARMRPTAEPTIDANSMLVCPICCVQLPSTEAYQAHLEAPALPCDVELVKSALGTAKRLTEESISPPAQKAPTSGVRLRKYIQQHFDKSRSAASKLINSGKVSVNDEVVTDSARLVLQGFKVAINDSPEKAQGSSTSSPLTSIEIETVARISDSVQVVWKPVGLRTKGFFPGTLEDLMARQEGKVRMESYTRLDTGLSGLCVVHEVFSSPPASVQHHFTALVMGDLPSSPNPLDLRLLPEKYRRWSKATEDHVKDASTEEGCPNSKAVMHILESCSIDVQGGNADESLTLSTIQLDVVDNLSCIGSLMSFALRKQFDLRVVGDRFSSKEYVKLPRSIRNRIKQKICLGCTSITLDGRVIEHNIPVKWKAKYWQGFLLDPE